MALTNNEKQIRHKKLEELKKYGNQVLIQSIFMNSGYNPLSEKSKEEIREEIESITNLRSGWTDEDYEAALKKIKNITMASYDNPHLMNNDIHGSHSIQDGNYNMDELRRAKYKAPEVVRNIKSILKLSELNKSDQIAVIAEVMRQLAKEILNEKRVPKTFANATALSLIGHQYEKPEWMWHAVALNLFEQNGKDKTDIIANVLLDPDIDNRGGLL
ncbi:MAG: hypothetical protein J6X37_00070 [Treponema sp.]|nr:hypothetical protein [Treponema sp.]